VMDNRLGNTNKLGALFGLLSGIGVFVPHPQPGKQMGSLSNCDPVASHRDYCTESLHAVCACCPYRDHKHGLVILEASQARSLNTFDWQDPWGCAVGEECKSNSVVAWYTVCYWQANGTDGD